MKKTVLFLVVFLMLPVLVFAHPAKSIDVFFEGKKVIVAVKHGVGDPTGHYIDTILIEVNDLKVLSQNFMRQISGNEQAVVYTIPSLKAGDKVVVMTHCSKGGNLKKEVVY